MYSVLHSLVSFLIRSLEPGQTNFQAFGPVAVGSFPSRPVAHAAAPSGIPQFIDDPKDPFNTLNKILDSPPFGAETQVESKEGCGEATFLDCDISDVPTERRHSTLEEIEKEVDKVRVALDEDCRALEEDDKLQAEADNWSLNVSCDSGVYNRASSRDSGPHSGKQT